MERELPLELRRGPPVIRVEKGNPSCARVLQRDIAEERRVARVFVREDAHPRFGERLEPRDGIVGGSVVDDDELPVRDGLRQHGRNRVPQIADALVRREDDRHRRNHRLGMPPDALVRKFAAREVHRIVPTRMRIQP